MLQTLARLLPTFRVLADPHHQLALSSVRSVVEEDVMERSKSAEATVRRMYEAIRVGDAESVIELVAEDGVYSGASKRTEESLLKP